VGELGPLGLHVAREHRPQRRVGTEETLVEPLDEVGVAPGLGGGLLDGGDLLRGHVGSTSARWPWSSAAATSLRLETPSLVNTLCRWLLTVRTDSTRRSATSLLERPCPTSRAISRSRRVS